MNRDNFEEMLKSAIKPGKEALPGRLFNFSLKMRLRKKAWDLYWRRAFAGSGKLKLAGAAGLVTMLTLGGGIGVYAYSSPDVNVLHPLYPVKQGLESAELYFAPTQAARTQINMAHARKRMAEMEKLSEDMRTSSDPASEEDGINRTLAMVQNHVETSLSSAADQDQVVDAEKTIDALKQNLEDVNSNLDVLSRTVPAQAKTAVRTNLEDMRQYTQDKLVRLEDVSRQIRSPMRIRGPRVIMRSLTDENADDTGHRDIDPPPGFTLANPASSNLQVQ